MPDLVIVAVGGPSSSGKSTCANALHCLFANSILVHLDDFYFPDSKIPIDNNLNVQNWDCHEAIDFDKFYRYLKNLKLGGLLEHDAPSLEIDPHLKLTTDEISSLKQKCAAIMPHETLVFIDGFMLFHDKKLISLYDKKLFFHASYETLKTRRESRQGYNTAEGFWVDPPHYFERIVWPEYVRTHLYLFENGDVNSSLNETAAKLGVKSIRNNEGTTLKYLVEVALEKLRD